MILDKKVVTAFIVTAVVVAGTALASIRTTTTTQSITIGGKPAVSASASASTSTTTYDNAPGKTVIVTNSPEAELANVIFRILGIPVSVHEITTYQSRNMGNGEIALAYNLAASSGRPVGEILDMRYQQKMGWGKIAKVLGVKLHGAADSSDRILREAKLDKDADDFRLLIKIDLDDNDDADPKIHKTGQDNDKDDSKKEHGKGHDKNK